MQGLSQHHKRLHSLAEHVPHGFRKKNLFEVLIRHNVPLLRATWFIKVTYLNQVGTVLNCVDFLVTLYSYFSTSLLLSLDLTFTFILFSEGSSLLLQRFFWNSRQNTFGPY